MKPSRVLIVDDHPMVCEALTVALKSTVPSAAIDTAFSLTAAADALRGRPDYDVVLLDLMLPDAKGFAGLVLVRQLAPNARVIVVSAKSDHETVALAGVLGASGFVDKASGLGEIVQSLGRIMDGVFVFPQRGPAVHQALLAAADAIAVLTPAQLRVMIAVADGRSNKQIAHDLGLSDATVKVHVSASLKKLCVPNRARAILIMQPLTSSD